MKYKVLNYTISGNTITLSDTSLQLANLCSILNEDTVSTLGVVDSILYSPVDKSKVVSMVNGVITLTQTLPSNTSLVIQIDDGLGLVAVTQSDLSTAVSDITSAIPTIQNIQSGLAKTTDLAVLALKTDIPSDYAKQSDIPSVLSIQNGLAKTNELPSGYALDSTVAHESDVNDGTHTTIGILTDQNVGLCAIHDDTTKIGTSQDTNVSTTLFGWLKSIRDFLVGIVTTNPYAKESAATYNKEAIISAINSALPDLTSVAKASTIGAATDTAAETTSSSLFSWVKKIRDYLYGIVTTSPYAKEATLGTSSDSSSANTIFGKLAAILAAFSGITIDTSTLAQRTDVKDGNDTAIGMLKDQTNGLAAIKTAAVEAKTAAQGVTIPTDYAKAGNGTNVTNTDIKNALTDNSTGLSAISGRIGQAPIGSSKTTLFAYLSSIWNSMEGQQEELPEGLADRVALLLQFFRIAASFEAEGVGHEQTDNTVINECKVRYAEVFGDLLPSDFVMPNSVTIDGITYTGTVS